MADQKVEVEFAGKSNIDEVTKKAASSMSNLEKNIASINKKFQDFGKDLFLSYLGPMALLNNAINFISNKLSEERTKTIADAQAARDLVSGGKSEFSSGEQMALSQSMKANSERRERKRLTTIDDIRSSAEFLETNQAGRNILIREKQLRESALKQAAGGQGGGITIGAMEIARDPEIRKEIYDIFLKQNKIQGGQGTAFKAPEGFSNVVGVGANPVMEAMASQLEEQRKQTDLLQQIANGRQSSDPIPTIAPAPSRASMLLHL